MALSLVAGPFELELVNDLVGREAGFTTEIYSGVDPNGGQFSTVDVLDEASAGVWHDSFGFLVVGTWDFGRGLCFVRPDGKVLVAQVADTVYNSAIPLDGFGYIPGTNQPAAAWFGDGAPDDWAELEGLTAQPRVGGQSGLISEGFSQFPFGVLSDRLIYASDWNPSATSFDGVARILTRPLNDGVDGHDWTVEYEFASTADYTGQMLHYAGRDDAGHDTWWVVNDDGRVLRYDSTAQEEVANSRTAFGDPLSFYLNSAGYSIKHRLFFVLTRYPSGTTQYLYVYSPEPVADSITAEVLDTVVRGNRARVRATVLGDQGEPCPGRVVTFSTTTGSALMTPAKTDANGVANAVLQAPTTAPSGTETLTATLVE